MLFKKQRGFTLIELVFVIMLMSIIAGISSVVISSGFKAYLASKNVIGADWQARYALERMARDIRAIQSPRSIITASARQLSFTDTNDHAISYSLSGNSLMLNEANIVADGVQSLAFSYFDKNGVNTAILANIRYVTITLNIILNNTDFAISTSVYPRNLS